MSSNLEIVKVCERCGNQFTAHKTTTLYCSHHCSALAYKARKRNEKVTAVKVATQSKPLEVISAKAMLSVTEASRLLGVTRPTLYRWLEVGKLSFARFDTKVLIRKSDIEELFSSTLSYKERLTRCEISRSDYYSAGEIIDTYGFDRSWLFRSLKKAGIERTFYRGRALYPRREIDALFAPKTEPVVEWLSVEQCMILLGVSRDSLYHHIKTHNIPSEKANS